MYLEGLICLLGILATVEGQLTCPGGNAGFGFCSRLAPGCPSGYRCHVEVNDAGICCQRGSIEPTTCPDGTGAGAVCGFTPTPTCHSGWYCYDFPNVVDIGFCCKRDPVSYVCPDGSSATGLCATSCPSNSYCYSQPGTPSFCCRTTPSRCAEGDVTNGQRCNGFDPTSCPSGWHCYAPLDYGYCCRSVSNWCRDGSPPGQPCNGLPQPNTCPRRWYCNAGVGSTGNCCRRRNICRRNMEYRTCGPSCPTQCGSTPPFFCPTNCVAGCFCKAGYILNKQGRRCITSEECRKKDWCPNGKKGGQRCGRLSRPCPNRQYCHAPTDYGYCCKRQTRWVCPPPPAFGTCDERCPSTGCPGRQQCCSHGCGHSCQDPVRGCSSTEPCPNKQTCISGRCVKPPPRVRCPSGDIAGPPCSSFTQSCPFRYRCHVPGGGISGICCRSECGGTNEVYMSCGTACPRRCGDTGPIICTQQCVSGCFCIPGFIRLGSSCIPEYLCPGPPIG